MSDLVLNTVTSGYNLSLINENFQAIQDKINDFCLQVSQGNNVMSQDLDMNSHTLLNLGVNLFNSGSILTLGAADGRYYNVTGDTLTGTMNVNGQTITGLKEATNPTEPVRKDQLDAEQVARATSDDYLQSQLNGTNPPAASAFSPISWHSQHIQSSLTIPDNVNAWSFGPVMTVDPSSTVTVGTGSFWTIAEGNLG